MRLGWWGAAVVAAALAAAPAQAATVGMEEITQPNGSVVGKFYFLSPSDEVNHAVITFRAANVVVVRSTTPMKPVGRCDGDGDNPTAVTCAGTFGVTYENAHVVLGTGNDRLVVQGSGPLMIDVSAAAGNDLVIGGPAGESLFGGSGADDLRGGGGNDVLFGELGNDRLYGQTGNDRLEGGFGNDRVLGQLGNDRVFGGPGNDVLFTGPGIDLAVGGGGRDFIDGRRDL